MNNRVYRSCKWLLDKLLANRIMTFREINAEWVMDTALSGGTDMLRKTFYNYRQTLKELFGVEVACKDGGDYAYYIRNPEILLNDRLTGWMLNNLSVGESLMGCKSLSSRIVLENIPSGEGKLLVVTDAMQKCCKLSFDYIRYGSKDRKQHTAEPWGLVLYHQRWYLLASFGREKKYTFGLDRMIEPRATAESFEYNSSFDAASYFEDFYGIYDSGKPITKIIIRAFGDECCYLSDLPIHKSQREIYRGNGYSDFMIELRPNKELTGYLLSRGDRLKVLSPDCIVEEMKESICAMMSHYNHF